MKIQNAFEVSVGEMTFMANKTSHIYTSYFILALKQQTKSSICIKYNCVSEDSSYCYLFFKRQQQVFQSLVQKMFYLMKKKEDLLMLNCGLLQSGQPEALTLILALLPFLTTLLCLAAMLCASYRSYRQGRVGGGYRKGKQNQVFSYEMVA